MFKCFKKKIFLEKKENFPQNIRRQLGIKLQDMYLSGIQELEFECEIRITEIVEEFHEKFFKEGYVLLWKESNLLFPGYYNYKFSLLPRIKNRKIDLLSIESTRNVLTQLPPIPNEQL